MFHGVDTSKGNNHQYYIIIIIVIDSDWHQSIRRLPVLDQGGWDAKSLIDGGLVAAKKMINEQSGVKAGGGGGGNKSNY